MLKLDSPISASHLYPECERHWRTYAEKQRRGTISLHLTAQVLARYNSYISCSGEPVALGRSPYAAGSADAQFLFNCYASGNGADREVVNAVRQVSSEYCPYCGLRFRRKADDQHHDIDHHLPRSVFPEFSILCVNLVTCCNDCNKRKGSAYLTIAGQRLFLHPYFDSCLTQQLLAAEVTATASGAPNVRFTFSMWAMASTVSATIETHVKTLDLLNRSADEATWILSGHLQTLAATNTSVPEAQLALACTARTQLASRPSDPLGLAFQAAANSNELPGLLQEARRRLPR